MGWRVWKDADAGLTALDRAVASPELEARFFEILSRDFGLVPENEGVREYLFFAEPEFLARLARFCRGGEFVIR